MKITGIEIGEYRQFKNIKFDFTYPEGHPKAGQPLEKVCFIGQSGTGKTTLLNVIWEFFILTDDAYQTIMNREVIHNNTNDYDAFYSPLSLSVQVGNEQNVYRSKISKNDENHILIRVSNAIEWLRDTNFGQYYKEMGKVCLYIEDGIANEFSRLSSNNKLFNDGELSSSTRPVSEAELSQIISQQEKEQQKIARSKAVGVSYPLANLFWQYILSDYRNYSKQLGKFMRKLIQESDRFSPEAFYKKAIEWRQDNANPLIDLAQKCLNPVLKKLRIEVDVDSTSETFTFKTTAGEPIEKLSTGTKQLITTALSIYKAEIKNGVILFDEPERSLFPDIQRELVKYYTGLAPEAQFFFATHSPIIAAAFEPEERFILYFDEDGEVKFRNGVAPIGDDPNDILRKDFGMSPLVPEEGVEAYQNYLDLATKIKNEPDIERRMELIAERSILGNKYDFPATKADEKN